MLNLDKSDEEFILKKTAQVEEYLSSIRFEDEQINTMFSYAVAGGRRARAVMVLLASESLGGVGDKILPAAAAVELGHKASLIHDDLVDGDTHRRGRESFHRKYGMRESIVMGDLLLGKAFSLLQELEVEESTRAECYKLFSRVYETMSLGQAKDLVFEERENVPLTESMRMIYEKTGVLCEMPMRLGATLAGGNEKQIGALGGYGRNMGIAFQVLNDINNLTGFEQKHGRGQSTDLSRGKKSSAISHALEHVKKHDRERIKEILSAGASDSKSIRELAEFLSESKTLEAVGGLAEGFMSKAHNSLKLLPSSRAKETLLKLSDPSAMRLGGYFLLEGKQI